MKAEINPKQGFGELVFGQGVEQTMKIMGKASVAKRWKCRQRFCIMMSMPYLCSLIQHRRKVSFA